ncbi:MAG: SGNH/GDSL hydrolase family protein [Phycisphaerales bacterium]|nr:MAG: SGNH/GDSL hydrolase family protein [Phycisphaerales bacterium]
MLTSGAFGFLGDYLLWLILYASVVIHTWCFLKFFPQQKRPRVRLVLGNALVFVCILSTIALVAESWLRFVSIKTDAFGLTWAAQRWFVLNTNLNSLNYRDEERTRGKPPGVRRIAFVGDSFVYGWGVKRAEDRFPERIEANLNTGSNARYEVLNVAKPGWGTGDEIEPIHDMIEHFGVDEVVLCYMPNDIEKLLPRTAEFDPVLPPESRIFNTSTSALLDYLWWRVYVPYVPSVRGYHDWLAEG